MPDKIDWLNENGYWGELRDYYKEKKNTNSNPQKHSRSIYAEAITEMCQKQGYFKEEKAINQDRTPIECGFSIHSQTLLSRAFG